MEDKLKSHANLVVRELNKVADIEFGYDSDSVAWLDAYIERQRNRADMDQST